MEFLKVYLETVFVLNGKKNARKHFLKNQERIIKVSKKSVTNYQQNQKIKFVTKKSFDFE